METKETDEELIEKIMRGLELSRKRLYEYKKRNNQELAILRDNKIVRIKPQ
ncbi:MAG: hypothetical protein LBF39_03135 [Prevotellaceae bacterium]|jgi:hypothetical protein|nr:hypothetical protein [Prevotellaceae bacterium]